jgi:ferredoxin, 2Fe-2S
MVSVTFVTPRGELILVEASLGESLMQAAVRARVPGIEAACGGSMACGTCHAYLPEPWFSAAPAPAADEASILEFGVHITPVSRLMCQIRVAPTLQGARITVPQSQA